MRTKVLSGIAWVHAARGFYLCLKCAGDARVSEAEYTPLPDFEVPKVAKCWVCGAPLGGTRRHRRR